MTKKLRTSMQPPQVTTKAESSISLAVATEHAMSDISDDITLIRNGFLTQQTTAANSALQAQKAETSATAAQAVSALSFFNTSDHLTLNFHHSDSSNIRVSQVSVSFKPDSFLFFVPLATLCQQSSIRQSGFTTQC